MSNEMHERTTGCLPVDQSCLALSRLSRSHRSTTPHRCCSTTSYLAVLGISLASLLVVVSLLCAIRCYLVRRRAGNRVAGDAAGKKRPARLGEAAIAALPKFEYRGAGGVLEECAVCIHAMADGELARQLPRCAHVFHLCCVDTWVTEHATCPVCRAEVIVEDGLETERELRRLEDGERDLEAQ